MEDLLLALEAKEREIESFLNDGAKQHSAMRDQLDDMTQRMMSAEEDIRRIRRARAALQNPSTDKLEDDLPPTRPSSGRAVAPSYGGR